MGRLISPMTSPPICRNDSFEPPLHRDRQANFKLSFPSSGFDIHSMRNPIIVALDVPTADAALKLVEQLAPVSGGFKIGSELFTSAGPDIVRRIRERGALVFLDLKFHDIPNTVAKAVAAAMQLDVQMLTVHTSGGLEMLKAAEQAAQEAAWRVGRPPPLVLGVTVLTSLDAGALKEIGLDANVEYQVRRLATVATKAGLRDRKSTRL